MTNTSATKIQGYFKVWDNGFDSDSFVTLAVVVDMDALLAQIAVGREIIAQHNLKAVRMDYHPDTWVGSDTQDDIRGLVVTEATFAFEHTGNIGTADQDIATTIAAVSGLRAARLTIYNPDLDGEELADLLEDR